MRHIATWALALSGIVCAIMASAEQRHVRGSTDQAMQPPAAMITVFACRAAALHYKLLMPKGASVGQAKYLLETTRNGGKKVTIQTRNPKAKARDFGAGGDYQIGFATAAGRFVVFNSSRGVAASDGGFRSSEFFDGIAFFKDRESVK